MKALLLKVFAAIGLIATVALVVIAVQLFGMVRNGFSARDQPSALEAAIARQMRAWATTAETRALKNPLRIDEAVLSNGREHWADHCANCHGNDGRGETPIGEALFPPAPNMREARTQALSDGELYGIIENGIRLTGMPAWGDGGPANEDSWALVAFIRHLPKQTDEEVEQMKELNPRSMHELREQQEEDAFLNAPEPGSQDPQPEREEP